MPLLYERYARLVYSLAHRICRNQALAEEVVQEVFQVLWCQSSRYSPDRGTFRSWLFTVAHHKSVDAVRREHTVARLNVPSDAVGDDWSFPPDPGADEAALDSVFAAQVRDALGDLPFPQRQTLLLAYYGGYTQREISSLIGVPLGTVKSRMNTAVRRLAILLRPLNTHPRAE